jgi:Sortilin, neurotensin receptor 3,
VTRAKKAKARRRAERAAQRHRDTGNKAFYWALGLGSLSVLAALTILWLGGALGDGTPALQSLAPDDPGPVHVHGLGIDPADGTLFIATHTGLYRVSPGRRTATRVGERRQDTMGFTVAGRNRFLGSGHPDAEEADEKALPPLLGLIESTDAGRTWEPISLLGEADFHVLRFSGERVYGYDASGARLMVSADRGRTWQQREAPGQLADLAIDPTDSKHVIAAAVGELVQGLYESKDAGETWRLVGGPVGLLGWPERGPLYILDLSGEVFASPRIGRSLDRVGTIGGEPAAFLAHTASELYAALHDGTIKRSTDAGKTWEVRSTP